MSVFQPLERHVWHQVLVMDNSPDCIQFCLHELRQVCIPHSWLSEVVHLHFVFWSVFELNLETLQSLIKSHWFIMNFFKSEKLRFLKRPYIITDLLFHSPIEPCLMRICSFCIGRSLAGHLRNLLLSLIDWKNFLLHSSISLRWWSGFLTSEFILTRKSLNCTLSVNSILHLLFDCCQDQCVADWGSCRRWEAVPWILHLWFDCC